MTKTVLMLAIAGAMMAGCATTPTASNVAPQNTYRVQGGMQAQEVPTMPVVAPCVDCGDPNYFDRVMAGYDFRRPYMGGCGDCGDDVWRTGFPGPVSWMPICHDCAPPMQPPVQQPEPQPTPEPTAPPHTKGDTPTTAPTTAPAEETTTVNY
ncbi:MAG: hypothetical protein ACK46X_20760 [Candidatus Sericytochromatia bacterium]